MVLRTATKDENVRAARTSLTAATAIETGESAPGSPEPSPCPAAGPGTAVHSGRQRELPATAALSVIDPGE